MGQQIKGINVKEFKQLIQDVALIKNVLLSNRDEGKFSEYLETFEIMSNPETMKSIRKSREDIKNGRVKKVESVQDMLGEL